jgi:hypothetical protein
MQEETEARIAEIRRDKPFSLDFERIEPMLMADRTKESIRSFLVTSGGTSHKLRLCGSEAEAALAERTARKFAHFVPPLHGREGRYLLVEYLEGWRELTMRELLARTAEIGKMCAEVHTYGDPGEHDPRRFFYDYLDGLRDQSVITPAMYVEISKAHDQSFEIARIQVSLDLNDISAQNVMVGPDGTLRYIDEEAIRHGMKGLGTVGLLARVERQEQWVAFLDGYNEVADSRFLTPAYFRHLRLAFCVRAIALQVAQGRSDRTLWLLERLQRELN